MNLTPAGNKLASLVERDESPESGPQLNIDAIVSSPAAALNTKTKDQPSNMINSVLTTPQTARHIDPPLGEMHPSKVQQSTTKQPDSGLRLGFIDVKARTASPVKATIKAVHQDTPTKFTSNAPVSMSSPGFDFKFSQTDSDLSAEAQRIMENVREGAARRKVRMQEERDEQARKDGETNELYGIGSRKIAKPKGKAGRYSEVHMQEFKKMDSIAGHVSAWKNKLQANAPSLKRSKSKAGFDQPEQNEPSLSSAVTVGRERGGGRLENTSPGKRLKHHYQDDTSAARPVSRDNRYESENKLSAPTLQRSKTGIPRAVTTPTKASLARAASVKNLKTSGVPSLSRSKSTWELSSPKRSKTEGNNKYLSSISRFGNMKSILHRAPPKFSDDPLKVAAGTHLPTPNGKMNLEKELPSIPGTPSAHGSRHLASIKRVEFTPTTKSKYELAAASPSPSKIPAPHFQRQETPHSEDVEIVTYPSLPKPISQTTTSTTKATNSSRAGDFTFRSPTALGFGPASPGVTSPTIRQVRPSGITTPLAAFENLPVVPHGVPNKKRRREDAEDVENHEVDEANEDEDGPKTKKVKRGAMEDKAHQGRMVKPDVKEKGKGILSRSRLNMLARPKGRRQV